MSLVQEFLQQNSGAYISPSLPIEANNITTALSFMVDQIQQTRVSFDKSHFIHSQISRTKQLLDVLNKFNNEMDKQCIELDAYKLPQLILESSEQQWKQYFIQSKESTIKKVIVGNLHQAIKQSNCILDKSSLQKYINKLEQVKSAQENNKINIQIIIEADKARIQFIKSLNMNSMKTISSEKINISLMRVKDSLNKISRNFDNELELCSRIDKTSTLNSPLKSSLKQHKIESPIRQVDSHRLISSTIQNQQSYQNSYLLTLGKPRFSYLAPYY